jgi:hypothetical protein
MVRRAERFPVTSEELVAARQRMEARLISGRPPQRGDLKTLWEAYQSAVVQGHAWGEQRLPDDLVAELRAAHDRLVRELRRRSTP